MIHISNSEIFDRYVRLNRFTFMGYLLAPVRFVESEGVKSQALALVIRDSMVNPVYDFILN